MKIKVDLWLKIIIVILFLISQFLLIVLIYRSLHPLTSIIRIQGEDSKTIQTPVLVIEEGGVRGPRTNSTQIKAMVDKNLKRLESDKVEESNRIRAKPRRPITIAFIFSHPDEIHHKEGYH